MEPRTRWIVVLAATLGLAIALVFLRTRQPGTAADTSEPRGTVENAQPAPGLVTDSERTSAALQEEARAAALARAREEQQQQWEALRREQAFTTPMGEALQNAAVIESAIKQATPQASEQLDSESAELSSR
jgi:hypothetical protein